MRKKLGLATGVGSAAFLSLVLTSGCGGGNTSSGGGGSAFFDKITPIVDASTPQSFRTVSASSLPLSFGPLAVTPAQNAQYFLTRTYNSLFSGQTRTGTIRGLMEDLDARLSEVESAIPEGQTPACVTASPTDLAIDTGVAGYTGSYKFSCYRSMAGGLAGTGSGLAFGRDDTHDYVSLILTQANRADFQKTGFFAKIDKTTKVTDLFFLEHFNNNENTNTPRYQFFRIKANPTGDIFEFAGTGNGVSYGPDDTPGYTTLFSGTRLITNGTLVYVEGTACASQPADNHLCSATTVDFGAEGSGSCFSATNFAALPDADCNTIKAAFSAEFPSLPSVGALGNQNDSDRAVPNGAALTLSNSISHASLSGLGSI